MNKRFLSVFCKIVLFHCVKTFVIVDFKGNVTGSDSIIKKSKRQITKTQIIEVFFKVCQKKKENKLVLID